MESSDELIPGPAVPSGTKCPFCLVDVGPGDETESCPSCHAVYHRECWIENGGCAVYGCASMAAVEGRRAIEVPFSYWGQENKPCPSCGQQILAAAVRCRHCGATFSTARPQDTAEFQKHAALDARLPAARKRVVLLFVLSAFPLSAPIGAVWGAIWRHGHQEELEALPPLYAALSRIGLITASALSGAMVLMTVLYAGVRGH